MPWPHMANATPELRGTLNNGGNAAANVPVRVATGDEGNACTGKISEASTKADGSFVVEPVREFRYFMVVMAHTFFPWSLCYKNAGEWVVLASEKEYSLVDSGPVGVQVAQCDLSGTTPKRCALKWQSE